MSNLPATKDTNLSAVESALVRNDISKLSTAERISYYNNLCESVGLNPMTKPFAFLSLSGREVVYATKDCAEQLRKIHGVSTSIKSQGVVNDCYEVHVVAKDISGRQDEEIAVIPIGNAKGADLANLRMKCVTKAKRRVTLSICGLGILDESELDTLRNAIKPAENPQIENPFHAEETKNPERDVVQSEEPKENLGDYVCRIGKKFVGKALKDLDIFELDNYVKWLRNSAEEKNKPLSGDFLEFAEKAEAFLCSREVPKLDFDEELK